MWGPYKTCGAKFIYKVCLPPPCASASCASAEGITYQVGQLNGMDTGHGATSASNININGMDTMGLSSKKLDALKAAAYKRQSRSQRPGAGEGDMGESGGSSSSSHQYAQSHMIVSHPLFVKYMAVKIWI